MILDLFRKRTSGFSDPFLSLEAGNSDSSDGEDHRVKVARKLIETVKVTV